METISWLAVLVRALAARATHTGLFRQNKRGGKKPEGIGRQGRGVEKERGMKEERATVYMGKGGWR